MSSPSATDLPPLAHILMDRARQDDCRTTPHVALLHVESQPDESVDCVNSTTSPPGTSGQDSDNTRVSVFTVSCPSQADGCSTKSTASLSEVPPAPTSEERVQPTVDAPVDLAFQKLSYSVNARVGVCCAERRILHEVSGEFRAGQLTAILGPSGAGKSSLLNVLSGYISTGVKGRLLVNGSRRDASRFHGVYIQQNASLHPQLTVMEAMKVAAVLKLGRDAAVVKKTIAEALESLGLTEQADTMTGRLSGGELKRLATALELITNPSVMFFDEPTSGLDSATTMQCVRLLQRLSRQGRTIVCTLHQPSASIVELLDHFYLLVEGRCAYRGTPSNVVPFLSSVGFTCPPYHNPADYALDVVTGEFGDHADTLVKAIDNGSCTLWSEKAGTSGTDTPDWLEVPRNSVSCSSSAANSRRSSSFDKTNTGALFKFPTPFWLQLFVLLKRSWKRSLRDRMLCHSRVLVHVAAGLLIGLIFTNIGNDAAHVNHNQGLLFFCLMFLMFTAMSCMISAFPLEMPMVAREHFNRWYSLGAYYLAVTLADVPLQAVCNVVFSVIAYFMTSQPMEAERFLRFLLIGSLVAFVAQSLGLIVGAAVEVEHGVILGPMVVMPFTVFSGYFIRQKDASAGLQWLFDISFLKYSMSALMLAVYGFGRDDLGCSTDFCMYQDPQTLLKEFGITDDDSYWIDVAILSVLGSVLRVVSFIVLLLRVKWYR